MILFNRFSNKPPTDGLSVSNSNSNSSNTPTSATIENKTNNIVNTNHN